MFNDHLSSEVARERIQQRMQEVEMYSVQKRLGFSDSANPKGLFILIVLITALAIGLLF